MEVRVTRSEKKMVVSSPYNPFLPGPAKKLGGKWDGEKKVWVFDIRDEKRVRDLFLDIYGEWEGAPAGGVLVTVRVTIGSRDWYRSRGGLFFCGRQVAYATGRDSGARLGEGVVVLEGKGFGSGGSVKNWTTIVKAGTVFEVRDVPLALAQEELLEERTDEDKIEIVDEIFEKKEGLLAEKEALLSRLAEIEKLLLEIGGEI